MQKRSEIRDKVWPILASLEVGLRLRASEPESFTVLVSAIDKMTSQLIDVGLLAVPDKDLLAELGGLISSLGNIKRSALVLQDWIRHQDDDEALQVMPLASEQYREAVSELRQKVRSFEAFCQDGASSDP
jgi:hypothetical protein